jgi:SM-20-related protein
MTSDRARWAGMEALAPAMDDARVIAQARNLLQRNGRVHVPEYFTEQAAQYFFEGCRDAEFGVVFQGSQGAYDLSAAAVGALNVDQRVELTSVIHAQASMGFQYLFDSYRISDEIEAGRLKHGPLAEFFAGLNAPETIARLRAMTGDDRIEYVDAQATRYRPGHFLTVHDDAQAGKDRLYAYVINLTPVWRADWGGLLMFLSDDGHVAEAFTPRWNALNILKVPQPHAVSVVAPFARGARFSITGWMRSRRP